jgi:hypothetical protein
MFNAGYCLVLFQRRMIIAFGIFFISNITLYFSMYLYLIIFYGTQLDLDKLTKMDKFEWMSHFYICASLTIMTLIMLWTIITMRRTLQANFYYSHINSELDHGLNYLKLRTIGIEVKHHSSDITSHKLVGLIKTELRTQGLDSTINAANIMPDYSKLFVLERRRAELTSSFGIISKFKPTTKMVLPNEMVNAPDFRKKLDQMDFKIDKQLMHQVKPSRTAFMSLNSLKSISFLKKRFR